jgi:hypothetical protein
MKTRQEIRAELQASNPTTNVSGVVYVPGDAIYEELMERWIDAVEQTPEPILPDAEKYQVLDWLDDHGITSAHVDAALQSIPDETQRRKALLRWHSVNRIPADNAFVIHVANQLNIDHREAWSQILAK